MQGNSRVMVQSVIEPQVPKKAKTATAWPKGENGFFYFAMYDDATVATTTTSKKEALPVNSELQNLLQFVRFKFMAGTDADDKDLEKRYEKVLIKSSEGPEFLVHIWFKVEKVTTVTNDKTTVTRVLHMKMLYQYNIDGKIFNEIYDQIVDNASLKNQQTFFSTDSDGECSILIDYNNIKMYPIWCFKDFPCNWRHIIESEDNEFQIIDIGQEDNLPLQLSGETPATKVVNKTIRRRRF